MRDTSSLSAGSGAGKWHRVSRHHPCPICGRPDWCSVSADGRLAACRRVEQGAFRSKTDKDGAAYYLHRLTAGDDSSTTPPLVPAGPTSTRADADSLHAVYSALLARLSVSAAHRADLQRRGLPDAEIDRRAYRTLPVQGRAGLARELRDRFGDSVLRVPGLVMRQRDGRRYLTLAALPGCWFRFGTWRAVSWPLDPAMIHLRPAPAIPSCRASRTAGLAPVPRFTYRLGFRPPRKRCD